MPTGLVVGLFRRRVFAEEFRREGVGGLSQEPGEVPVEPVRVLLDKVVRSVRHLPPAYAVTSHPFGFYVVRELGQHLRTYI